ncbi:uncharacterized protein LOC106637825 isoform X1 [Copidosoma floridanum]|uniref:uncharacterized protein LOC106637825 isoform X1 n=1 Tax=Copidosoma floridanum TaxID=29053 RepID=UPI0006C95692|nr:uncharacterized protein LOC106637825 isoform X1 [Copidosoma floridanum]
MEKPVMLPWLMVLLVHLARPGVQGLSTIASEEEFLSNGAAPAEQMSGCYFSAKYQGEFVMQVPRDEPVKRRAEDEPPVRYAALNITFNAIPAWGYCYRRIDDKVLLRDRRGGYDHCIRCFRLARRSANVIEVFSQSLDRCYANESLAVASCQHLDVSSILYRTLDVGDEPVRNEFCPLSGKYRYKYSVNYEYGALEHNSAETRDECTSFSSDVDNCPNGSILNFRFRRCTFEDHDATFECLGSWPASPGARASSDPLRYVAFLDSRGSTSFSGPAKRRRPRYRCGLYHVDSKTGKTYLTLSSDSSCSANLHNSTSGYESLVLSKTTTQKKMPDYVIDNLNTFPRWAQGEWEETLIVNGTMTFNDLNGYKSFTFVTVDSNDQDGRYIVFFRDQCEQEAYSCMVMKQRSENVLEFMTVTSSSPVYQPYLCNNTSRLLDHAVWWTLARLEPSESACPITGQYIGQITDVPGTCAELSSNCYTRQIMYYKVYGCETGELFEERTYLCLGQWEEKGLTYTYTMRNDTKTHECFVGAIVSDDEIYIKEAGDYCLRTIDPRTEGMRLYKNGECYGNSSSPAPTIPTKTTTRLSTVSITTPVRTVSSTTVRTTVTTRTRGFVLGSFTTTTTTTTTSERTTSLKSSTDSVRVNGSAIATLLLVVCLLNRQLLWFYASRE